VVSGPGACACAWRIGARGKNARDSVVLSPEDSFLSEDLVGELLVLYAFDLPGLFEYLSERDRKALGLDMADLRSLAVRNLTRRRSRPQTLQGSNPVVMLRLDGDLEASLLLVDRLWPQLARGLAGETIVAVPSRDVLAISGTEVTGGVEALRRAVQIGWERPTNRKLLLTRSLLVRRGASWQIFEPA
jgi:hypothetical protein